MTTKGEIADRILTTLRRDSKDRFLSRRYVLNILEEKMTFLLSQKLRDRSLYRESNLYTTLECYEFEEIENIKCDIIEFRRCESIMKGKKKLPTLIYSRYGDSINYISNLDVSIEITETNPKKYINDKKRRSYKPKPMYYIKDGFPYLVDTKMEVGEINLLTLDTERAEEVTCKGKDKCKPSIDYEFIGSDKLRDIAVQQTLQEIAGTFLQIQPDENPDNNENSL